MSLLLRKLRSLTRLTLLKATDLILVYSPTTGKDHYVLLGDLLLISGGYPEWNSVDAAAGTYDINYQVTHGFKLWKSLINNNAVVPAEGVSWTEVSPTVIVPTLPTNLIVDCGGFDASSGLYPSTGGTGVAGVPNRGNVFYVTVASAPDGNGDVKFPVGSKWMAKVNTPGQTDGNWLPYLA